MVVKNEACSVNYENFSFLLDENISKRHGKKSSVVFVTHDWDVVTVSAT